MYLTRSPADIQELVIKAIAGKEHQVLVHIMHWEGHDSISALFLPTAFNWNLSRRQHSNKTGEAR
jgi:hypothetical protein